MFSILLLLAGVPSMTQSAFDAARGHAPADVRRGLDRWEGCNHWGGEEAYDRQRARQIEHALNMLRCDRLPRDIAALRKHYARRGGIRRLLAAAHALYD